MEDIVKIRGITSTELSKRGVDDNQNLMFQSLSFTLKHKYETFNNTTFQFQGCKISPEDMFSKE